MYYLYALYNNNWVKILPKSNNLTWSNDKDTLSIELNFDSIYDLAEGTQIILKNDLIEVIKGLIVKKSKKKFTNAYSAFDFGFYLNKNETLIQFNKIAGSSAIGQLCDKFGISHNITPISTVITKIYNAQTLSSIIDDILDQATKETGIIYVKEMIGYVLTIKKLNDLKIYPKVIIGKDFDINTSIEEMKNSVLATSSGQDNTNILASVEDGVNLKTYGKLQKVITVEDKDKSQAKNIAQNYLLLNNKIFMDTNIPMIALSGGDDIKANRLMEFNIPSMGLIGWHKIKSASHTLNNNIHKVSVTLEW